MAFAEAAVRAVRYPPLGERFYAPLRHNVTMADYLDRADDEVLAIATIEHIDALQHIEQIVATPGLDLAFIGPGDLATSMGLKGRADHPDVQAVTQALESAIRDSATVLGGVAAGYSGGNRGDRSISVQGTSRH